MKVLIISHNPITTYDAMGKTMSSLFSGFEQKELCQLYIYPTIPDIDFCSSYYRITDKDVLKSYFKFSVNGSEIEKSEINANKHLLFENPKDEDVYRNRKNKTSIRILLRDIMWKFSSWYNKNLKHWLNEQAPNCIFVAPGNAKFLYDIALKISNEYNIPIIAYICDEYYFVEKPKKFLDKTRIKLLQNKIRKLMKRTSHIVTICENLKELYSKEFSVPATVIMTGTNYSIAENPSSPKSPQAITYMGNIRCNRFNSLAEIGKELQNLNKDMNTNFHLDIYTAEKNEAILRTLGGIETIRLCGYVGGKEFYKVFHSAEILLHTEAFDDKSIDSVKNSVSTKIADSLASGICLFAYGPSEVASMQHLIDNSCAVAVTDKNKLYDTLKELFFNSELREGTARKAIETAKIYHDSKKASLRLKEITENINENIAG